MKAWALGALLGLVLILAAPFGCQLYLDEPWYNGELAKRLKQRPGPFSGPVDVTGLVSEVFPNGTPTSAGLELMKRNGFECVSSASEGESTMVCERTHSSLVCSDRRTIKLFVDGQTIAKQQARAW